MGLLKPFFPLSVCMGPKLEDGGAMGAQGWCDRPTARAAVGAVGYDLGMRRMLLAILAGVVTSLLAAVTDLLIYCWPRSPIRRRLRPTIGRPSRRTNLC